MELEEIVGKKVDQFERFLLASKALFEQFYIKHKCLNIS